MARMRVVIEVSETAGGVTFETHVEQKDKNLTPVCDMIGTVSTDAALAGAKIVLGQDFTGGCEDLMTIIIAGLQTQADMEAPVSNAELADVMGGFIPVVAGKDKYANIIMAELARQKASEEGQITLASAVMAVLVMPIWKDIGNYHMQMKTLTFLAMWLQEQIALTVGAYESKKLADQNKKETKPDTNQQELSDNIKTQIDNLHLDDLFKKFGG